MSELRHLLADSWDAIEFLRAAMFSGAKKQDGADQSDREREETPDKVSTGAKPKSRPPMNLDAMESADAELAVMARWADVLGIPYSGVVWRVNGEARGVLYGDTTPARSIAAAVSVLLDGGWLPPVEMVDQVREVRTGNRNAWPELDVFLQRDERAVAVEPVSDPNQFALL